jgi:hypothetical protein
MLNVTAILDRFESAVTDSSAELRQRALIWLNMIFKRLSSERDWLFLYKTAAGLPITNNLVTLPADFKRLVFCESDDHAWYLIDTDQYSLQEVAVAQLTTSDRPNGWTISSTGLQLWPAGSTSTGCNLTYIQTVPDYADTATDTIFPDEAEVCVHRLMLSSFYEYDFDERAAMAASMAAQELRMLKHWDNQRKPAPQYLTPISVANYAP